MGYYCDSAGITETALLADQVCPAGSYCSSGLNSDPDGDATYDCTQGFYCPEGTLEEMPCPAGSYGAAAGLSASGDCTFKTPL